MLDVLTPQCPCDACCCCRRARLQAPTPFLMGLHAVQALDASVLEVLVVADLDAGNVSAGREAQGLLQRCLAHPYLAQLLLRLR